MDTLLYITVRPLVALLQSLPLPMVAWLGRRGGALAYLLDGRHRRMAVRNLVACFGSEKTPLEIRALAKENFRRIGENYACAVKTAAMDFKDVQKRVQFVGAEAIEQYAPGERKRSVIVAIGHFGNFELYARFGQFSPGYVTATTYRGLRQPSLNRLMQSLREKSGCLFFERRTDAAALKAALNKPGLLLGLLSDQHAGDNGLWLPFLGRECSTSAAPAVLALRYDCPLFTGICYRVGLARWRIEGGAEIPTCVNGKPRAPEGIMLDVNRAFEAAVRRDPANWFWVHNRWKPQGARAQRNAQVRSSESSIQKANPLEQRDGARAGDALIAPPAPAAEAQRAPEETR